MSLFNCQNCKRPYPEDGVPHRCLTCGGIFGLAKTLSFHPDNKEPELPGIWQYRHSFGLPDNAPVVSLGEGNTPLIPIKIFDKKIYFKLEFLNPTGSFKDRLTAPEMSFLLSRGVKSAVEDSSGNAGASFAAYAAHAGIQARVFVPAYASGPKRVQIEAYGAELVSIEGLRSNAAEAVINEVENHGAVYASHAYLPFGLPGLATIAYEITDQLGGSPGAVVSPVGHGSLLLGMIKGFSAMKHAGIIAELPRMIGVQAQACAPLWALQTMGPAGLNVVFENDTLAEGVRIRKPIHGDVLLKLMDQSNGHFVAVEEKDILLGQQQLAHLGLYVEPTSAIVWNGLEQVVADLPEPIVVILTGSGLKTV